MGAAGVEALRRHLEDPDGAAPHAVAAPAEDDSVDPPGKNPAKQHLALLLVKRPTDEEVHQAADDCIENSPTKQRKCGKELVKDPQEGVI
ncbi:MAG TPA: hypothetical protein VEM94_00995 [Candidatus Dormibacteraeota bacterium]|nr:hypothetical protein [Candidatus Dormibacteraeota bacterium]